MKGKKDGCFYVMETIQWALAKHQMDRLRIIIRKDYENKENKDGYMVTESDFL